MVSLGNVVFFFNGNNSVTFRNRIEGKQGCIVTFFKILQIRNKHIHAPSETSGNTHMHSMS